MKATALNLNWHFFLLGCVAPIVLWAVIIGIGWLLIHS